jgi:thiamine pyrophosphokinase
MKAFIYTGGNINVANITEHPKSDDLCIAADSGYKNAKALGERIDILLGDFDSIGEPLPEGVKTITVPAEKDFTDTQLAVNTALEKGADEIVIIGGLGGRLDHTLANLGLLEKLGEMRVYATATDGYNRVRYINATSTLIARSQYKYVSILPIDKKIKGVDIEGCKYPLKNATLTRDDTLAVSNEVTGNCALICVRKGACYIIESID